MHVHTKCRPTMPQRGRSFRMSSWRDPNVHLKVLIAIVQLVKLRAVFFCSHELKSHQLHALVCPVPGQGHPSALPLFYE